MRERISPVSPRFSLHRNDGKLGMGSPGAGNTQPRSHQSPGIPSSPPQDSLAGKEGDPGEAKVVGVHKDVLHKEVWGAAVL